MNNRSAGLGSSVVQTCSQSGGQNATLPNPASLVPESTPPGQCPRCTFQNHPSLPVCEICGAPLLDIPGGRATVPEDSIQRTDSPGQTLYTGHGEDDTLESVRFSFRLGGEKTFHERLQGAMVQRKWLLYSAPPVPKPSPGSSEGAGSSGSSTPASSLSQRVVGIAGLEQRGHELRKNNEMVIGNAFEDLEALMTSAKEIIALAESFASRSESSSTEGNALLSKSASALGMVTTKDMFGSGSNAESLYISELSRNLAEFLTDDTKGILKREGGIVSLVDLWAIFNRTRGGVELVSPTDFHKAAQLWDKLRLPVRLRRFKSGLLVVQGRDRTDEKTIANILSWLKDMHDVPPPSEVTWDWHLFGRGVTAQEAAERFGWSVGVAGEELEMAEDRGVLCREQGIEGSKFWENWIVNPPVTVDQA